MMYYCYERPLSFWAAMTLGPPLSFQFLGLHSHSHSEGDAHLHHGPEANDKLWKLLAVLGGLYLFFLLEKFFTLLGHSHEEVSRLLVQSFPRQRNWG